MIIRSLFLLPIFCLLQVSSNLASTPAPGNACPTQWGPSVTVKKRPRTDASDVQDNAKKPKSFADLSAHKDPKKPIDADGDTAMSDAQPVSSAAATSATVTHPENEIKQKATNGTQATSSAQSVPMTDVDQKETAQQKRCNNLLILLDPEASELINESGVLIEIMAQNIFHQFTPMLVSGSLVQTYFCWLEIARQKIAELKSAGQDPKPWIAANSSGPLLVAQALSDNPVPQSSWFIHQNANLILCIPHRYLAEQYPMCTNISEQVQQAGFNVGPGSEWVELTTQTFSKYVMNSHDAIPLVKPITSCLFKDPHAQWNILLCGHGTNALLPSKIEFYEKSLKEHETRRDQLIANGKSKGKLAYIDLTVKKMRRQFDIQKAHPHDIVADTTEIGGLDFAEFIDLLKDLNEHNVVHLHCKTCSVGGYNRVFMQEALKVIKPKFLLTIPGGCDGLIHDQRIIHTENRPAWRQDYQSFFKDFRKVLDPLCREQDKMNLLGKALGHLYAQDINPPYGYIYLPETAKFEPFSYGFTDIQCLNEAHTQYQQPLVVDTKLTALIVQSQNVQTPLHFQNYCQIFCAAKTIKKHVRGEKLYLVADPTVTIQFKEIQTPLNFAEFMKSLLSTCHYYPHRFLIEKLCYKVSGNNTVITNLDFLYVDDTYTPSCRVPKPENRYDVCQEVGSINADYMMDAIRNQDKTNNTPEASNKS